MDEKYKYYLSNKDSIDKLTDRIFLNYQPMFAKTYLICDGAIGCAQYLALLAYPSVKEVLARNKFFASMISAYCRFYDKNLLNEFRDCPKEIQDAWLIKKHWRTMKKTLNKVTGRLKKRHHAYHAYAAYNQSILDGAGKSFEEILSWISQAYESEGSKLQDPKGRIENLKTKIHRPCRPIYHLVQGYYEEHLIHYPISERHPMKALIDSDWLEGAIIRARKKLATELLDYDLNKHGIQKSQKLKFEPSEIVHLELASKPFIGICQ